MSIRYECNECGSVFKIKDSLAGTKGKCPTCQTKFVVPQKGTNSGLGLESIRDSTIEKGEHSPGEEAPFSAPPATSREAGAPPSSPQLREETPSKKKMVAPPVEAPTKGPAPAGKAAIESPVPSVPRTPASGAAPASPPPPAQPAGSAVPPVATDTPPANTETTAETHGEVPQPADEAEADNGDFDVDSFLSDPTAAAAAKASAGLTTPTSPTPDKPQYDKQGRRLLGAALARPGNATDSPAASAAAEAVDAALEGGQVKAAPLPVTPRRKLFEFSLSRSLSQLRKRAVWVVLGAILIAGTAFLSNRFFAARLDLPVLAPVSGTVTVNGKPLANVTVHLTPVFAREGKSATDQPLRLRDSIGVTDGEGHYSVQYLDGVEGAPLGNVRVWIETIRPADLKTIPVVYLSTASTDIRAVKEAGNDTRFDLKLKSP